MRIRDLLLPSNAEQYKTPIVVARTFVDQTASATNWIVTPPTTPVVGRLLLVFVGTIQARTPVATGWTSVALPGIVGAKGHVMLWKVSAGTETSITINLGSGSQGTACYYEVDNVDTSTTFYDVGVSANQDGADPYFSAASTPFTVTRPSVVFSSTVFINSGSDWAPDNNFIYQGTRLSATAHKVYKFPVANEVVTWTKVGGLTSSTKVSMVEIYGKERKVEFVNAGAAGDSGAGITSVIPFVPMPSVIEIGALLVAVFTNRTLNVTNGIDVGASTALVGWTQLGVFSSPTAGEFGLLDVWCKYATGSEGTLVNVIYLNSSSNVKIGRVFQFRNVGAVVGGGFAAGKYQATNISPINLTSTKPKSVAVSFMMGISQGTLDVYAGATGGEWSEPVAEYSTSTQNGSRLGMNIADMATPGTLSGGSMVGAASNVSFSFILESTTKEFPNAPFNDTKVRVLQRVTAVAATDTDQTATIVFPTPPAAGNLIILYASYIQTFQNATFPSGFVDFTDEGLAGNIRNSIAWKIADGITTNYTVTLSAAGTVKLALIAHEIKNAKASPVSIGKQITASTSSITGPVHSINITPVAKSLAIIYMGTSNIATQFRVGVITTQASLGYGDMLNAIRNRNAVSAEKYYPAAGNELPYWFWVTGRSINSIAIQIT